MSSPLLTRSKKLGLEVIKLADDLPQKQAAYVITQQIIRSATSVGANYRAACRAKSTPDFINKLKIVEEEADETHYWLEILEEAGLMTPERIAPIKAETNEIISMVVASIKTLRSKQT